MVKGIDKESEVFSTFIDAFDHFSQSLLPRFKPAPNESSSNIEKIKPNAKGLKIFENLVFSENPEKLETISSKLASKLLKKSENPENLEKTRKIASKFLIISRKILSEKNCLELKFILRLAKLLKFTEKASDRFEVMKELAKYLTRQNDFEGLSKVLKVLKEENWEFGVSVIFSFSSRFSGYAEQLQDFIQAFNLTRLTQTAISEVLKLLENFSTESDTNLSEYFRVLLLVCDILLNNPKTLSRNDTKLKYLLLKSLQQASVPKNYPQKLQLLDRLCTLETETQVYIPGLVLHVYELLNSHIFQKRSKSLRVMSVNFDYQAWLTFEEQTSEKYKAELATRAVSVLKKHLSYLKSTHPASLSTLKIQLSHLESTLPSSISSSLKSLIKL